MLWVQVPLEATFLKHPDANFIQKWQKCQICVIYENLDWNYCQFCLVCKNPKSLNCFNSYDSHNVHIRGFPKVDHSGRSARIVLEQINSAKKKTSPNRTWTLDPGCTAHFLSLMPYPCARSHCLKDWDFNDPYIAMIYWFQLTPLSSSKSKKINRAWLHKDH